MNRKPPPEITEFYDDEERELVEGIEAAMSAKNYHPKSVMTAEKVEMYQESARNALNEKTVPVTLRISRTDLVKLKGQAIREDIPYQSYIKSILHKSISS